MGPGAGAALDTPQLPTGGHTSARRHTARLSFALTVFFERKRKSPAICMQGWGVLFLIS